MIAWAEQLQISELQELARQQARDIQALQDRTESLTTLIAGLTEIASRQHERLQALEHAISDG